LSGDKFVDFGGLAANISADADLLRNKIWETPLRRLSPIMEKAAAMLKPVIIWGTFCGTFKLSLLAFWGHGWVYK
jgi:hypothetical protein